MAALKTDLTMTAALNSIGENILLADLNYDLVWMNDEAEKLFAKIAPLFGYNEAEDLIGKNMDTFHKTPSRQREIMENLTNKHKVRINIKNKFIADIVITPLNDDNEETLYYIVMLMDVTTKAEEDERKDHLIESLSIPILKIWDNAVAVPLIGDIDDSRLEQLISSLLRECTEVDIQYALIDLSGISTFNAQISHHLRQLNKSLQLVGTECLVVGFTPKLALSFEYFDHGMKTFKNTHAGLQYILSYNR
ncbi:Anti-anti-sigma regulatory factor (antagonist of anti-sigma factor) [Halobacillus dabanensis]|uniref:Anti-anti-sigma regulatory factor (Antagonist of anti-sigma factor) n=1 Tax=Halobacillus dabanensis TaxID=240302 RepID=A0A1I3TYL2_HALDA|nr:STAS domain-containing protein [Halobacillus dabanensis]SFJ74661.1 Anti-anti-sigma regulatory factor (antagonist of anti-sigma factor) [Halobacillus dabanensis]